MNYQIYVLIDPNTNKIRYVGQTSGFLSYRLNSHVSKALEYFNVNNEKEKWIRQLYGQGQIPIIKRILKCKDKNEAHSIERQLIIEFSVKFDLFNIIYNPIKITKITPPPKTIKGYGQIIATKDNEILEFPTHIKRTPFRVNFTEGLSSTI